MFECKVGGLGSWGGSEEEGGLQKNSRKLAPGHLREPLCAEKRWEHFSTLKSTPGSDLHSG